MLLAPAQPALHSNFRPTHTHRLPQVISLWANSLGAFLTLASARLNLDPALTSAPLVTTIVDTTGLVIYFQIASSVVGQDSPLHAVLALLQGAAHAAAT